MSTTAELNEPPTPAEVYRQAVAEASPANGNTPLDNLAAEIRALVERELEIGTDEHRALVARYRHEAKELDESFEPKRLPLRVERGRLLIEARKLVPARSWEKWCRANLCITQSDIRACIALAKAEDPIAAHETEKTKTRERVAKHRHAAKSAVTAGGVTAESPPVPVAKTAQASASDARIEAVEMPEPETLTAEERAAYHDLAIAKLREGAALHNKVKETKRKFWDTFAKWWTLLDEDERRAFGEWFDELRTRADLDLAAE